MIRRYNPPIEVRIDEQAEYLVENLLFRDFTFDGIEDGPKNWPRLFESVLDRIPSLSLVRSEPRVREDCFEVVLDAFLVFLVADDEHAEAVYDLIAGTQQLGVLLLEDLFGTSLHLHWQHAN